MSVKYHVYSLSKVVLCITYGKISLIHKKSTLFQNTLTILCYLHMSTRLLNSGYVNNLWLQPHTTTILFSLISPALVRLDITCNFSNVCKI